MRAVLADIKSRGLPRLAAPVFCSVHLHAAAALGLPFKRQRSWQGSTPPERTFRPQRQRTLRARMTVPLGPQHGLIEGWTSLGTTREEICLDFTLPTGQSFRWKPAGIGTYTGVIGARAVKIRQLEEGDVQYQVFARGPDATPAEDMEIITDFFNLATNLQRLGRGWAADARFKAVQPYFPGARVLRQDPLECLFQFVCSSNNHISRIHGMVSRLCSAYGTRLTPCSKAVEAGAVYQEPDMFFAFPTLDQLQQATEEELRAAGFGYRAKFITGSVAELVAKPGGGQAWLHSLRTVPYAEATAALCSLPGVGPKVAACVCLFALDKHAAIPVDTHVWQLATRYYTPSLKGKTLSPKIMAAVEQAFEKAFGPYCGWAHNTLFISDLASQRHRLPQHLGGTLQSPAAQAAEAPLPTADRTASVLTAATDNASSSAAAAAQGLDAAQDRSHGPGLAEASGQEHVSRRRGQRKQQSKVMQESDGKAKRAVRKRKRSIA